MSEIRLPKGFGSAGDFTLMSGSRWRSLGGHYEGIRFSNNHVDSLLGLQHADMGGDFEVLGNIYHSDHADSWNNFAAGDGLKHHHGNNYDWNLVRLPYRNPGNWGMADFIEERNDDGFVVLKPPVGLDLRRKAPDRIVIPPEFSEIENMTRLLVESLREIKKRKLKVVIYGLGDQIKKLIMNQQSGTIRIVGYIDENRLHDDFPHRRVTWQEMGSIDYDVVLIGSLFWARPLHAKALQYVPECRIMPRSLTLQSGKGKNINTKGFTETAARDSPGL